MALMLCVTDCLSFDPVARTSPQGTGETQADDFYGWDLEGGICKWKVGTDAVVIFGLPLPRDHGNG